MKLTKVDELILQSQEHWHLNLGDNCYFCGEYTARQNWTFSSVNQFILNFKKTMDREGCTDWRYKGNAIRQAATVLAAGLSIPQNLPLLRAATLVPIPPSSCMGEPLYDDRLLKMLTALNVKLGPLDIRHLVKQRTTYQASHATTNRLTPGELAANYQIDETLAEPPPASIWIFDDLLVTGSHYKAMVQVLAQRFPAASFVGMFLARRVSVES